MLTHKQLKTLYLFLLAICPNYIYPMYLALKSEDSALEDESSDFVIQGYPANLQYTVCESILSQLNTYQTTLFEDNQIQDKEEIKQIGVLKHQISCFVIKNILTNSIGPEQLESIPNSLKTIKDILYRGLLFIPYSKMITMDESELFNKTVHYQSVTGTINESIPIDPAVYNILQNNLKILLKKASYDNFYYPGRNHFATHLNNQNKENAPLLNNAFITKILPVGEDTIIIPGGILPSGISYLTSKDGLKVLCYSCLLPSPLIIIYILTHI